MSALWPVATCRGDGSLESRKDCGVKPPKAKAATGRRTPNYRQECLSYFSTVTFFMKPQSPLASTLMFPTFFCAMTMFAWYHNGKTGTSRVTIS